MPTPSDSPKPNGSDAPGSSSQPAPTPTGPQPVPTSGPVSSNDPCDAQTVKVPHYTPIPGTKKYKRVGDYDIVSKLGQGAMGSVYLAKQMATGKMVALKILPPDLAKDEELLERFKRESRVTQRLSHPNIVSAVEFGTFEKYHYIAIDYVDGPDLETMLKKSGAFPNELLLKVASAMCSALEETERHGIVHRDFKPSNIMMTSGGVFRLTDLGLATAGQGDQRLTLAGFAVGTPYYLSPEQARGQLDVDIRADMYGLGATLYHLGTGNVPFPGTNPVVVMTQHISTPLRPPCEVCKDVSKPVSGLICLLMEKEPEKRPQNTKQLREAINQAENGQVPGAKAQSATVQLSSKTGGKQAATEKSDDVDGILDSVFSFIPKQSRLAAAVGVLVIACLALVFLIIMLLKYK
ncbi:MAG: serine/threonine-protein kinase [Planctomycetota bacterium]